MKNPNAVAVLTTSSVVIAGEQLISQYVSVHLPSFWAKAVIAGVTTAVVYIGKDGLKGALLRLGGIAKRVWAGPPQIAEAKVAAPPPAADSKK